MRIPAHLRDLALGATGGIFLAAVLGLALPGDAASTADQPDESVETGGFAFTFERTVPGSPRETYDALTGDISGWWDHTFANEPYRLYIEPRPGGGFYEIFDKSGDAPSSRQQSAACSFASRVPWAWRATPCSWSPRTSSKRSASRGPPHTSR